MYFSIIIFVIITMFIVNCSYQLQPNILNEKLQNNNNNITYMVLHSYDPFGSMTRAIRIELYKNKINLLDKVNNDIKIKNTCMCLYIIDASENHITTSVFPDGTEAGYQLILYIKTKLLISDENCYPINIRIHRSFIRNSVNALSNYVQENDIRELMYQEAAEKIVCHINLQYQKHCF